VAALVPDETWFLVWKKIWELNSKHLFAIDPFVRVKLVILFDLVHGKAVYNC
jgi:hypothetical protein